MICYDSMLPVEYLTVCEHERRDRDPEADTHPLIPHTHRVGFKITL